MKFRILSTADYIFLAKYGGVSIFSFVVLLSADKGRNLWKMKVVARSLPAILMSREGTASGCEKTLWIDCWVQ